MLLKISLKDMKIIDQCKLFNMYFQLTCGLTIQQLKLIQQRINLEFPLIR